MHRIMCFLICSITIITGCSRDHSPDKTKQVYERLHGKYNAVSSVSSEAVDVNLDGTATHNILSEIPDLANCDLEIRIVAKDNFLLSQSWPEQYIGHGIIPAGYDPSLTVNYARQGVTRTFSLDASQSSIQVHPDTAPLPDPTRFPFPQAVTVEETDRIKIVFSKKLYTSAGWKTTTITTIYERYTMTT